jgi:hypothetical protein
MVMNNFGKRNFMQPMGRLGMALMMGPYFFLFETIGGVFFRRTTVLVQAKNSGRQF